MLLIKPISKFWQFLMILCLLSACQVAESEIKTIPSPQPTLAFVPYVHPEPSSTISLQDYISGLDSNILETTNPICIELDANEVIEDGDSELGWKDYLERSKLFVDGQSYLNIAIPDSYFGNLSEVVYTYYNSDTGKMVEASYAPGPFTFCWEVILDKGLHTVEFQTRKTSGKVLTYNWSFYINN